MPENPTGTIQSWIATALPVGRGTDQSKTISQPIWLQPQRVRRSGTQTVILQPDFSTSTQPPHSHCPCISLPFSIFFAISSCHLLVLRASLKIISPNNNLTFIIAV
ncbi:hypothetical protein O181_006021 [Austropuccinia psidii MF-1]|uniref:Uncharacterized protein n=1 Tax=Austropuccinia psidii MF-1 TaxID=1389203 RepID=A0A9Q3BIE3_9BASI|nr:hypothetical protein [Austropuccinia psidii MF-1]